MIWSGRKTSAVPVSWILCFFWLGFSSKNIKNCETFLEFLRGEDQFDPSQVICLPQTSNRKRFLDPILHLESQETSIIILSIGTSVASSGHINLQHIQNHQMNQMTVHLLGRNVKHDANALDSILIPLQVDRQALPKATIWKITNSRSNFTDRWGSSPSESSKKQVTHGTSRPLLGNLQCYIAIAVRHLSHIEGCLGRTGNPTWKWRSNSQLHKSASK